MYVSSFRDLQTIYEDGYRGMSYNPSPNKTYAAEPSNHSYRRDSMSFNPSDSGNLFAYQANSPGIGIADDEEHEATGVISKEEIISKIKKLMQTANEDEMLYAVHLLGQLKEFVKAN
jgi:hypothetical protein